MVCLASHESCLLSSLIHRAVNSAKILIMSLKRDAASRLGLNLMILSGVGDEPGAHHMTTLMEAGGDAGCTPPLAGRLPAPLE